MILSDRYRWPVRAVAAALLAASGAYWAWLVEYRPEGYWAAVEQPEAWDGREISLSLFTVIAIEDGAYTVRKSDREVRIEGDTAGLALGQDLYVKGSFRAADLTVVEVWRDVAQGRPGKWRLAVVGLLFLAVALPRWFTLRDGELVERA